MTVGLANLIRRPISPGDAAVLAELLNAIEVLDVFGEFYSEEDAADQINAPLLDLERGTVGVFDGDRMVGYSSAAHKLLVEDVHRVTVSGGVHPEYRRRGLGAELLAAGIASAKALHAIHHPGLPLAIDAQNNAFNDSARLLPSRWHDARPLVLAHAAPTRSRRCRPADAGRSRNGALLRQQRRRVLRRQQRGSARPMGRSPDAAGAVACVSQLAGPADAAQACVAV